MLDLLFTSVMPLWMCSILDHAEAFPTCFSKYGYCYQNHLFPQMIKNMTFGGKLYA